jgi:hypothetical protein
VHGLRGNIMTTDEAFFWADAMIQAQIDGHYARIMAGQRFSWEKARRSTSQRSRRLMEKLLRDYIALKWAQESQE